MFLHCEAMKEYILQPFKVQDKEINFLLVDE